MTSLFMIRGLDVAFTSTSPCGFVPALALVTGGADVVSRAPSCGRQGQIHANTARAVVACVRPSMDDLAARSISPVPVMAAPYIARAVMVAASFRAETDIHAAAKSGAAAGAGASAAVVHPYAEVLLQG